MLVQDNPESWPVSATEPLLKHWLISVRSDKVQLPDKNYAERTVVSHPGAVAVLALDEASRVLMIRQYRHPVGYQLWEIPAGLRDVDDEPLLATAQRELREETGYQAREWRVLLDTFSSPGFTTEQVRIFLARGLEEADDVGYEREGEEKFLVTQWVPLAETVRLALAGRLHNAQTIAGVLAAHAAKADGFNTLRPADAPEEA